MTKERNKLFPVEDVQGKDHSLEVFSNGDLPWQGDYDAALNWYDIDPTLGANPDRLLDYVVMSVTGSCITIAGNDVAFTSEAFKDDQAAALKYIEENIDVPIDPEELIKLGFKRN